MDKRSGYGSIWFKQMNILENNLFTFSTSMIFIGITMIFDLHPYENSTKLNFGDGQTQAGIFFLSIGIWTLYCYLFNKNKE